MIRFVRMLVAWLALLPGLAQGQVVDTTLTPVSPDRAVPMSFNLAALADWEVQQPFVDRMKVARPWIGHLPGRWGGVEFEQLVADGVLDANGWPKRVPDTVGSLATLVMTDLDESATSLAGRYVLRFDGDGIVEVTGRATNVRYAPNRVSFDYTPGPGAVEIRIQRTDRRRSGDYVRNITIMREDRLEAFAAGAIFNPDFLAVLDGASGLRFMGWMLANQSPPSLWDDRPRLDDFSYFQKGIPLELVARLANMTRSDPWLTLPHNADDTYFRRAAEMMQDQLDPALTAHVELSNEVWNWDYPQADWAARQAEARWGTEDAWMQIYAMRAARMSQIWREVFGATSDRLVTVISSQTGWFGLEEQPLEAPLWVAEGNPAPYSLFDAYAITAYFDGRLGQPDMAETVHGWIAESTAKAADIARAQGLEGQALQDFMDAHRYDHAVALAGAHVLDGRVTGDPGGTIAQYLARDLPYHKDIADRYGLRLMMYEGGTHVVGLGLSQEDEELTAFFNVLNYAPEMGVLYTHVMRGWARQTDAPFLHFQDMAAPSRWGSWGNLRHHTDENPRWSAIQQFLQGDGL